MSKSFCCTYLLVVICALQNVVITECRTFGSPSGVWGVTAPSSSPSQAPSTSSDAERHHKKIKKVKRVKTQKKDDLVKADEVLPKTEEGPVPSTLARGSTRKRKLKGILKKQGTSTDSEPVKMKTVTWKNMEGDSLPSVVTSIDSSEEKHKKKRVKKVKKGSKK
eukprot:scaffold11639_cov172-Amphora_coffeaeformis.AAC.35